MIKLQLKRHLTTEATKKNRTEGTRISENSVDFVWFFLVALVVKFMLEEEDVFYHHRVLGEKPHGHEETSHSEHNVFEPNYCGFYLLNACK
jgi:hypothetical protein